METKLIVDAIEKGNVALEESRKIADEIKAKQDKGDAGIADLTVKQEKAFAEFHTNFKAIEDAVAKLSRKDVSGEGDAAEKAAEKEYRMGFKQYMRGKLSKEKLHDLEQKSMTPEQKALAESTNSGADGGYAVPKVIDSMIESLVVNISPMRQIANVVQIGTNALHKLVNLKGMASGWVAETAARPATNTPALIDVVIPVSELYANPQATQVMMDDVFFDAEAWIAEEVSQEFNRAEGAAFVAGDGSNKPLGLLAGTPVATADGARAFGVLQYVPTGVAGGWAASNPADIVFSIAGSVKAPYRANARFLLNKSVLFDLSSFKDSGGRYIFAPIQSPTIPASLLGFPITEAEDMPSKAANAFAVAFGDFKRGYTIVDRKGMVTIRDPYSNKPYVGFYTVKRVGGAVVNSEAVKLIKFSVS